MEQEKVAPVIVDEEKATPIEKERGTPIEKKKATPIEKERGTPIEKKKAAPVEKKKAAPVEVEKATPIEKKEGGTPTEEQKSDYIENQPDLPVYFVYSDWSLKRLDRFLKPENVGILRILKQKGRETYKSLVVLNPGRYKELCRDGYDRPNAVHGLIIYPYRLRTSSLPEVDTHSLFVYVPPKLLDHADAVVMNIESRLELLVDWKVIPKDCFLVKALMKSREHDTLRGGCKIKFSRDFVTMAHIALVKKILDGDNWDDIPEASFSGSSEILKCDWFNPTLRRNKPKKDLSNKKTEKESKSESTAELTDIQKLMIKSAAQTLKSKPTTSPSVLETELM